MRIEVDIKYELESVGTSNSCDIEYQLRYRISAGISSEGDTVYDREVKHDAEVKHQYLLFLQLNTTYKYVDIATSIGPHIDRLGLRVPWGTADDGPGVGEPWAVE